MRWVGEVGFDGRSAQNIGCGFVSVSVANAGLCENDIHTFPVQDRLGRVLSQQTGGKLKHGLGIGEVSRDEFVKRGHNGLC